MDILPAITLAEMHDDMDGVARPIIWYPDNLIENIGSHRLATIEWWSDHNIRSKTDSIIVPYMLMIDCVQSRSFAMLRRVL